MTDHLAVNIGTKLLGIVPGRVSTECDAHLSYDTQGTIDKVGLRSVQSGLRSTPLHAALASSPLHLVFVP